MENENKITTKNLISSLLFLVLGIILLTTSDGIISIISKAVGAILILAGVIKSIHYIYLKGKLGEYSIRELIIGIIIICFGVLFILFSSTFGFAVSVLIGIWTLFSGINRLILALAVKSEDVIGFRMFLGSAVIMILIGIVITSGLFDKLLGVFIIIYSISEIVDYIYCKYSEKKKPRANTNIEKHKKLKDTKVVDAIIEEDK